MHELPEHLSRQLRVRREVGLLVVGAVVFMMGSIVTFSESEFTWPVAMLVGALQAVAAWFLVRKKLRLRQLIARGEREWPCSACGQRNPVDDGFTCGRCRVSAVTVTGEPASR